MDKLGAVSAQEVDVAMAEQILAGAKALWDAMADHSMTDSYGGMECQRVLPEAVMFIYQQANLPPPFDWATTEDAGESDTRIKPEGRVRILHGPMAGRIGIVVAMLNTPIVSVTVRVGGIPYGPFTADQVEVLK